MKLLCLYLTTFLFSQPVETTDAVYAISPANACMAFQGPEYVEPLASEEPWFKVQIENHCNHSPDISSPLCPIFELPNGFKSMTEKVGLSTILASFRSNNDINLTPQTCIEFCNIPNASCFLVWLYCRPWNHFSFCC